MKKKKIILVCLGIVLLTLFVNILPSQNDDIDFSFTNVEALAEGESGEVTVTCVEKGGVCWGINSEGRYGMFPGLSIKH